MSFDEKYRLLDLIEDGSAQTFVAEEIATGQKVNVFLFAGEQARTQAELIGQLSSADNTLFPELIETGKNNDTPYVVTQLIGGFAELKMRALQLKTPSLPQTAHKQHEFSKVGVWRIPQVQQKPAGGLRDDSAMPPSKGQPVAGECTPAFQTPAQPHSPLSSVEPPPPEPVPGEFTSLFQAPAAPIGEPAAEPETRRPEPAPGEFTRLFQAAGAPMGEETAESEAPPSEPGPAPGEFTRLFQAAGTPMGEKTEGPKASPSELAPGEFTQLFQSASAPSGQISEPRSPTEEGQFTRVFGRGTMGPARQESSGQFTGIFQSQVASAAPLQPRSDIPDTPPTAYMPAPGEFTQIFGNPSAEAQTPVPDSPQTSPAPGEYTRMFSAQSVISAEEPAPIPPAPSLPEPSSPAKQTSNMPLILAGIIMLLLILIAVLLITMRK